MSFDTNLVTNPRGRTGGQGSSRDLFNEAREAAGEERALTFATDRHLAAGGEESTDGAATIGENLALNPSVEIDDTGWAHYAGLGATSERTAEDSWVGQHSYKVVAAGESGNLGARVTEAMIGSVPSGTAIAFKVRCKIVSDIERPPLMHLIYRDTPAGNDLHWPALSEQPAWVDIGDGWFEAGASWTVEGGNLTDIYINNRLEVSVWSEGDYALFDGFHFATGDTEAEALAKVEGYGYGDGDAPGWHWDGEPHASTSYVWPLDRSAIWLPGDGTAQEWTATAPARDARGWAALVERDRPVSPVMLTQPFTLYLSYEREWPAADRDILAELVSTNGSQIMFRSEPGQGDLGLSIDILEGREGWSTPVPGEAPSYDSGLKVAWVSVDEAGVLTVGAGNHEGNSFDIELGEGFAAPSVLTIHPDHSTAHVHAAAVYAVTHEAPDRAAVVHWLGTRASAGDNFVANPRGRTTDGTVVVVEGYTPRRQVMEDAIAAYSDAPVTWSTTTPAVEDRSTIWVHPATGEAREWRDNSVVVAENLVPNPRGRNAAAGWVNHNRVSLTWSSTHDALSMSRPEVGSQNPGVDIPGTAKQEVTSLMWVLPDTPGTVIPVRVGVNTMGTQDVNTGDTARQHGINTWGYERFTFSIGVNHETVVYYRAAVIMGNYSGPYFDGDTPDDGAYRHEWTGEPHNSPSRRIVIDPDAGWYPVSDSEVVAATEEYLNYEDASADPDLELVDGNLVAPAPVGWFSPQDVVYYSRSRDAIALRLTDRAWSGRAEARTLVQAPWEADCRALGEVRSDNQLFAAHVLIGSDSGAGLARDGHGLVQSPARSQVDVAGVGVDRTSNTSPGETFYWRLRVAEGDPMRYGDGDSEGWEWSGEPHHSTSHSLEYIPPPPWKPQWFPVENDALTGVAEELAATVPPDGWEANGPIYYHDESDAVLVPEGVTALPPAGEFDELATMVLQDPQGVETVYRDVESPATIPSEEGDRAVRAAVVEGSHDQGYWDGDHEDIDLGDGTHIAHRWTGTPHASTTTRGIEITTLAAFFEAGVAAVHLRVYPEVWDSPPELVTIERRDTVHGWQALPGWEERPVHEGAVIATDIEAPLDASVQYRIVGSGPSGTQTLTPKAVATTGAEWGLWLKNRSDARASMRVNWSGISDVETTTQGGVYEVIGGAAIGQWSGTSPEAVILTVFTEGAQERRALQSLLRTQRQLFLQTGEPKELDDGWWQVIHSAENNPQQRVIAPGSDDIRYFTLDLMRIAAPSGAVAVGLASTWSDFLERNDTWRDAAELTWLEQLEGN